MNVDPANPTYLGCRPSTPRQIIIKREGGGPLAPSIHTPTQNIIKRTIREGGEWGDATFSPFYTQEEYNDGGNKGWGG